MDECRANNMEPLKDECILKSEADELDPCLVDVLQNLTTLNGPLYTDLTKGGSVLLIFKLLQIISE